MEKFNEEFRAWLEESLSDGVPSSVAAFAFNLSEKSSDDARYAVEFVGASEFDPHDPDWACAEVWEPSNGRNFAIPSSFCDGDWEACLDKMKGLVASLLNEPSQLSTKLRSVNGLGIGFVDGELILI
ncbi:MAG: hypothetical protein ACREB7_02055 [Sphingopyxis sp.]|uniref:hypothetical protein n=1 Tax=Sphingopyxis sp. TaxID=1908224 RepID=UPI003D6D1875